MIDLEAELRTRGLPLVSLESQTPLRDFDVVEIRRTWHFDGAVRLY